MKVEKRPVAVAIYIVHDESSDNSAEFLGLIHSAGYTNHPKIFKQHGVASSKWLLSEGTIQELSLLLEVHKDQDIDAIVLSDEMSPKQALGLEETLNIEAGKVIDKFELILKVFEAHSITEESRLRCQLARMRRELPLQKLRLLHKMGSERKAAGGIGGRGPGISKIDVFVKANRKQQATVEKKLTRIRSRRELQRRLRQKDENILSISVLGYTSAGKSTLVNSMAQSSKLIPTDSSMFTTLSPQTRRGSLSGLRCLLTDTVGFIEDLPEILRESFLSTLEEGLIGDLLLLCVDISESKSFILKKLKSVLSSIENIGGSSSRRIVVLTKKDLGISITTSEIKEQFKLPAVAVSAATNDV